MPPMRGSHTQGDGLNAARKSIQPIQYLQYLANLCASVQTELVPYATAQPVGRTGIPITCRYMFSHGHLARTALPTVTWEFPIYQRAKPWIGVACLRMEGRRPLPVFHPEPLWPCITSPMVIHHG